MKWILLVIALFIGLPILEVYILYKIAGATSVWVALGIVVGTGFVGGMAAKIQGMGALRRLARGIALGESPTDAIIDGVIIVIAGVLLITPGVVTDLVGICLLLPPIRRGVGHYAKRRFMARFQMRPSAAPRYEKIEFEVKRDDRP